MKRILLAIALLWALTSQAQLLWKVTGNGLEKPSYLFGTYHLMPDTFVDSVPGLPEAIKSVDAVWTEVENATMTSPEVVQKISKLMIAPADSTIDVLLSKEGYEIVDGVVRRYLGTFGIGLDQVKNMRPSALANQFVQLIAAKKVQNINPAHLLDGEVERRAKAIGKLTCSLESVDYQLHMLFGSPLKEQAAQLLEMCKSIEAQERNFLLMHNAYAAQDLEKLTQATADPEVMTAEQLEKLCFQRNRNWLPTIINEAQKGSILVAVGAAHLTLDQGLINLLHQKGYTVEPVRE
ncbi:MAG: TraB/GumN family protein [Bacteroidales bacterium]|nr:TraB/GumN family protein [Bacteroidales bacterium]